MADSGSGPAIAVLASGRGSNLQALIDAQRAGQMPGRIVLVAGDRAEAPALRAAETAGIPTLALAPAGYAERSHFDAELFARIAACAPDLIVLAGFMRVLSPAVLEPWAGRILNIHPSLLPRHRGLATHRKVLAAGDHEHGASVHFVTAELDGGPVLAQARIPVPAGITAEALGERVLEQEHRLLPACVALLASGRVRLQGEIILLDGVPLPAPLQLGPADTPGPA